MHLSDFHFNFGETQSSLRHSLPHLRGIEKILAETNPDLVVVTGDLSAHGDTNALERAYNWLVGKETFDGDRYGLNLLERAKSIPYVVVAGNSDFTPKSTGGNTQSRINESLSVFRRLFSQEQISPGIWHLRTNQENMFLFELTIPPSRSEQKDRSCPPEVLKSYYSGPEIRATFRAEWKRIANFHSNASHAGLIENGTQVVTSSQYARAPKFLVTHYPLLDSTDREEESIVKDFLLNLASIGVHVMFCGHQHIQGLHQKRLSQLKLKKKPIRSVLRYLLLCLGITEPPQLIVGNGKRMPMRLSPILASFVELAKSMIAKDLSESITDEAVIYKCEELLDEMLSSRDGHLPSRMIDQLRTELLKKHKDEDAVDEVACIEQLLLGLTPEQIRKLREVSRSKSVSDFYREFCNRNIVQCRCGSSGKVVGPSKLPRNLQVYDVLIYPERWTIGCKAYFWGLSEFSIDSTREEQFQVKR
jgi:predicted phosphodiesterase